MKILIIEDERFTANDLIRTITSIRNDAEIVAVIPSVEEGIAFFGKQPSIDLIFSDIQLGDGLSFEIFEQSQNTVPVIFCTAYNEYALEAFKTFSIDYLLKPFSVVTVERALQKYEQLKVKTAQTVPDMTAVLQALKSQLLPNVQKMASVIIQQGDKIIPLSVEQIALFYIENDCVFAYTFEQKRHLLSQKLEYFEQRFTPNFFRANRQFLVNRKAIKDASHYFNRKIIVNLTIPFSEPIMVGKLKVTAFVEWLAEV